jgi:nucleotide-binding universal stress UspA family protein
MRRIVVGLKDSVGGRAALGWAARIAVDEAAHLDVVSAWRDPRIPVVDPLLRLEVSCDAARAGLELMQVELMQVQLMHEELGVEELFVPITQRVICGEPGEVLVACSEEADLLVLGRSRHRMRWLSSTSRACQTRAACPVTIVPGP